MATTAPSKYKLSIKLKDESFQIEELHLYHLYLQIGLQSFEFCVVNNANNKCLMLEEYDFSGIASHDELVAELQKIWENHHVLKAGFWKKVRVSYKNQYFTTIPTSLFSKENRKDYLEFTSNMQDLTGIASYTHISFTGVNVFAYPESVHRFLESTYTAAKLEMTHATSAIMEAAFRGKLGGEGKTILLNVEKRHLEMVVTDKSKLLFCNRFQYTSVEDFIYFVMLIYRELDLNPEIDPVFIFGEIAPNSPLYEALHKYIRHTSFGKRPKFLTFSYHFDEIFDHRCLSTYAIHLCE